MWSHRIVISFNVSKYISLRFRPGSVALVVNKFTLKTAEKVFCYGIVIRLTLTRYKISGENVIGNVKEDIQHYDLINIVMLCLGSSDNIEDNAPGMLNTLLSDTMSSSERIEILDKKFDFDMSPDDVKEVSEMCNVSRGVYDKGIDRGIALGRKEGIALGMDRGITLGMN